MSRIVILSRKKIQFYTIMAAVVILAGAYIGWQQSKPALSSAGNNTRVIQLVTGEFTALSDSGQKLESYRWDPGTVVVKKGEHVELRISGINGQSHPFVIEGLNISGEVHKGKTTIVRFTPKDEGIYAIVCQTHADPKSGGPMVGYLVVQ
jgi:heme/copper-type cytochrome/quinol oxidase subunit 2